MPWTRLIGMTAVAVLVLVGCGGDDDDDGAASATSTSAPAATTTAPTTTAAATTSTSAAQGEATVSVATDDQLGEYLVGPDGRTLYLFTRDEGTTTACTGGCANVWPPLVDAAPTAGEGVDAGELATAEGIEADQVVYHGHLLYYFAQDEAPGDTNGVGIPNWFAVSPDGEAIEAG